MEKGSSLVSYKYNYHGPFQQFDFLAVSTTGQQQKRGACRSFLNFENMVLKKAYNERLCISGAKHKDLLDLVKNKIIPPAYSKEYADLPVSTAIVHEVFYDDIIIEEELVLLNELFNSP